MKKALVRRVVSLFLCFCMVIGFVPIIDAQAAEIKGAHSTRIPVIWNWNLGISLRSM